MKNINEIKSESYLARFKCLNCDNKEDFCYLNKKEDDYNLFMNILNYNIPYKLQFCDKCNMETLHLLIAIESNNKE